MALFAAWVLDEIYKQKLGLENYPDPETFRDELNRDRWEKPRDFVVVRRPIRQKNGQLLLFPQDYRWHYQVICHNQPELSPKEVGEDYNQRARIELTIKELDYNYFLTKAPTDEFLANFAHMWHCVLAHNIVFLLREWATKSISTLRKKLFDIPGRLVNRSGRMVMRLIKGFKEIELLNSVLERLRLFYQKLYPLTSGNLDSAFLQKYPKRL